MFPLIVHVGFHIGVVVVNICQVFMPLMPWATHMMARTKVAKVLATASWHIVPIILCSYVEYIFP